MIHPLYLWVITIVKGGLYIGILGQAERLETKMDSSGASRPKQAWVAWPGQGPVPPVLGWCLDFVLLTSSPLGASCGKILTPEKSQVNLSPRRSLKRKNTQNRVFLFYRVITEIRGSMENPHKTL
jgi:hypothetical protein